MSATVSKLTIAMTVSVIAGRVDSMNDHRAPGLGPAVRPDATFKKQVEDDILRLLRLAGVEIEK